MALGTLDTALDALLMSEAIADALGLGSDASEDAAIEDIDELIVTLGELAALDRGDDTLEAAKLDGASEEAMLGAALGDKLLNALRLLCGCKLDGGLETNDGDDRGELLEDGTRLGDA